MAMRRWSRKVIPRDQSSQENCLSVSGYGTIHIRSNELRNEPQEASNKCPGWGTLPASAGGDREGEGHHWRARLSLSLSRLGRPGSCASNCWDCVPSDITWPAWYSAFQIIQKRSDGRTFLLHCRNCVASSLRAGMYCDSEAARQLSNCSLADRQAYFCLYCISSWLVQRWRRCITNMSQENPEVPGTVAA